MRVKKTVSEKRKKKHISYIIILIPKNTEVNLFVKESSHFSYDETVSRFQVETVIKDGIAAKLYFDKSSLSFF